MQSAVYTARLFISSSNQRKGITMKKLNVAAIVIFGMILLVPLVTFNFKPNQISVIDNRMLTDLPSLNMGLIEYIKTLDIYFQDRIGLRTAMITSSEILQDKLFGVLTHPEYANGKDGYVFFKVNPQLTDYNYVSDFANFTAKLQKYCNDRGVNFLFSLDPNKQIVYQQYLPDGVNYKNDRVTDLLNDLTKDKVNHVYTAPALIAASKTSQVYNVKYDAGHWNDNGAFVGISLMLENIKKDYPSLTLPAKSDYNISYVLNTTLPQSYFPIHEEDVLYTPKEPEAVEADKYKDEIKLNSTGWYYSDYVNPSKPNAPKILVFMGSYFENKEKFIADNFSETVFVHSYLNVQDFDYYFNLFHPDIVLFQSADYATDDAYYPQKLIDDVNYNPAYKLVQNLPVTPFAGVPGNAGQELLDTAQKSKTQLTDFSLDITGKEIAYAYARIDGQIDDFKVDSSGNKQTIDITLDKSTILNAKNIQLMLISADKKQQNVITLR